MSTLAELLFRAVDGVFVVDAQKRIVFWDPGCAQLFGQASASVLGRRCSEVVRGKDSGGQLFCGDSCSMASLNIGDKAPGTFPLCIPDARGQEQRFAVSIVLVPSLRNGCWYCVHLLRRGEAVDPMAIMMHAAEPSRQTRTNRRSCDQRDLSVLSPREKEILKLLAEGLKVGGISQLLNIRPVTVRNHVQHIQAKLGVHSQAGTVAYAYRHNLV
jgi:DNA-binding CsgD family transcriptional regulator